MSLSRFFQYGSHNVLSSSVNWGYRDNFKPVLKPTNETKISAQEITPATFFMCAKTSKGMKIVCFTLGAFMRDRNIFVKKINRFETVPIASIYTTTDVYPPQAPYQQLLLHTYFYPRSSVRMNLFFLWKPFWISSFYENLFEYLFFMRILSNLFYLWESLCGSLFLFFIIYFLRSLWK